MTEDRTIIGDIINAKDGVKKTGDTQAPTKWIMDGAAKATGTNTTPKLEKEDMVLVHLLHLLKGTHHKQHMLQLEGTHHRLHLLVNPIGAIKPREDINGELDHPEAKVKSSPLKRTSTRKQERYMRACWPKRPIWKASGRMLWP